MSKKVKIFFYNICVLSLLFALVGCRDDFLWGEDVGEGTARVSATLDFKPMLEALDGTRAAGNSLKDISSLHVLLYDSGTKKLIKKWTLSNYELSDEARDDGDAENGFTAEAFTKRATFELPERIDFGRYYMYAVANVPNLFTAFKDDIETVEGLKEISLTWNSSNISANGQMLGFFSRSADNTDNELLIINQSNVNIHSWLRRAASKVTVAFDGTKLEEGVSIYLKSVTIKDIPKHCMLGKSNTVVSTEELQDGETIEYGSGASYSAWPTITKDNPFYYRVDSNNSGVVAKSLYDADKSKYKNMAHSEMSDALFFYENMQGEGPDKRQKDEDGDGIPDAQGVEKDGMEYGSYIEVLAYYNSTNPKCLGSGTIKYRFMLGKNIIDDYDAERNHHYKLTLVFKKYANDPDWHIEHEKFFSVTQPKEMNYQGQNFTPTYNDSKFLNLGYNFSKNNPITVTCFEENLDTGEKVPIEWDVEFMDEGETTWKKECDWLLFNKPATYNMQTEAIFRSPDKVPDKHIKKVDIDDVISKTTEKGQSTPYNLASSTGTAGKIENTANTYMVDAKGTYMLPLVYGNGYENSKPNSGAYTSSSTDSRALKTLMNHTGSGISSPFIADNPNCVPSKAELVWEDEKGLITNISYTSNAYTVDGKNKGGITFKVAKAIQGNAIIAIKNAAGTILWSWQIWVTNLSSFSDDDKVVELTKYDNTKITMMPVHLGWCSGHGEVIKYYPERRCKVKFSAPGMEDKIVEFVKRSHIAFPMGNTTDYQWGRKDPFVAPSGAWDLKPRYDAAGNCITWHPGRINPEPGVAERGARLCTRKLLHRLIQNPDIWMNPPRVVGQWVPWVSNDTTYVNLWDPKNKTVYDPSPVGYRVCPADAFTGFTVNGQNSANEESNFWYQVRPADIVEDVPKDGVMEFYINSEKLQSTVFPISGYRDWDAGGGHYQHYYSGKTDASIGYTWSAENIGDDLSYNLMFSRTDKISDANGTYTGYVYTKNQFYPCDGFPVRPCVYNRTAAGLKAPKRR